MSIDWNGKLECDNGEVIVMSGTTPTKVQAMVDSIYYWVCKSDGVPMSSKLTTAFVVRNVKTNRDKAIEIARKHDHQDSMLVNLCRFTDALIEAGLLKED